MQVAYANLKSAADALIRMVSDETGRFKIYGIMSAKYGTYGLLLNDWIGGEQNWNLLTHRRIATIMLICIA